MGKMRKKMSAAGSKKLFRRTAESVHPRNAPPVVMRGGYRL